MIAHKKYVGTLMQVDNVKIGLGEIACKKGGG
jgi:hypothetical protein